jgi:hypothetical protein
MPMWPTRAEGRMLSMPSTMPVPARRIGTSTIFLPSSMVPRARAMGVSTSVSMTGRSRVTS